jgi:hypothetical protein
LNSVLISYYQLGHAPTFSDINAFEYIQKVVVGPKGVSVALDKAEKLGTTIFECYGTGLVLSP